MLSRDHFKVRRILGKNEYVMVEIVNKTGKVTYIPYLEFIRKYGTDKLSNSK